MKTIERYIQFGIDRQILDYEEFEVKGNTVIIKVGGKNFQHYNLIEFITSKEFIEAVVRGIYLRNHTVKIDNVWDNLRESITIDQAIAIKEDKLEEFIDNLLTE